MQQYWALALSGTSSKPANTNAENNNTFTPGRMGAFLSYGIRLHLAGTFRHHTMGSSFACISNEIDSRACESKRNICEPENVGGASTSACSQERCSLAEPAT